MSSGKNIPELTGGCLQTAGRAAVPGRLGDTLRGRKEVFSWRTVIRTRTSVSRTSRTIRRSSATRRRTASKLLFFEGQGTGPPPAPCPFPVPAPLPPPPASAPAGGPAPPLPSGAAPGEENFCGPGIPFSVKILYNKKYYMLSFLSSGVPAPACLWRRS